MVAVANVSAAAALAGAGAFGSSFSERWNELTVAGILQAIQTLITEETAGTPPASAIQEDVKKTVWDGIYTEEQAQRGMEIYTEACGYCHLEDLRGDGIAPGLIGSAFSFRWNELTVANMLQAIQATMPQDAPGSLSPQAYIDTVSYLLKMNEIPAGETELPPAAEQLEQILITEKTAGAAAASAIQEDAKKTVWDGIYTEEQAQRGMEIYTEACGYCHLEDLRGDGIAPGLIGSAFSFRWNELTVANMLQAIQATMPQDAPGSLSPQAYIDTVSYLLKMNEIPTGETELPPAAEQLEQILITEKPPQ